VGPLAGDLSDLRVLPTGRTDSAYSARRVFSKLATLRGDVLCKDLMSIAMMHAATVLGDMIGAGGHYVDQCDLPLPQSARPYRKACARGDRWHFRAEVPNSLSRPVITKP
jgi:hypothetical protein